MVQMKNRKKRRVPTTGEMKYANAIVKEKCKRWRAPRTGQALSTLATKKGKRKIIEITWKTVRAIASVCFLHNDCHAQCKMVQISKQKGGERNKRNDVKLR